LRRLLAIVLPRPGLFRLALLGARFVRPLAGLVPDRLAAMRHGALAVAAEMTLDAHLQRLEHIFKSQLSSLNSQEER